MAHKVFVGLSGGVDSAVSAALLQREGHEVTGVFIKIWQPEFLECTWREDRLDAMRVAASLNIPFREIDLSEVYKREVIDSMLKSYTSGETPNPDVLCNRSIKFGAFARWAREEGADAIATGHYARTRRKDGVVQLLRGADKEKDQSYFLHRVEKHELARASFPIGDMTKQEVRSLARSFKLPVATRPDSQGLCFVGDVSMSDFLKRYLPVEEGIVLDQKGEEIGKHDGAALYTIGQRHGFRITKASAKAPHYVTSIDTARNIVTVSERREDAAVASVRLEAVHWISAPEFPASFEAQTRYREAPVAVNVKKTGDSLMAQFEHPHIISPGQAIVLYRKDECLGGAVMRRDSFVHNSVKESVVQVQ